MNPRREYTDEDYKTDSHIIAILVAIVCLFIGIVIGFLVCNYMWQRELSKPKVAILAVLPDKQGIRSLTKKRINI